MKVYRCNPEFCDEGYHEQEPVEFLAWLIDSNLEEYQSFDGDTYCIPHDTNLVRLTVAYRMPCWTWFETKPELIDLESL